MFDIIIFIYKGLVLSSAGLVLIHLEAKCSNVDMISGIKYDYIIYGWSLMTCIYNSLVQSAVLNQQKGLA